MSYPSRWSLDCLLPVLYCSVLLLLNTHCLCAQEPFGGKPRYAQPTPLSDVVNSNRDPADPSITGDGLALFWDVLSPIEIWTATRTSLDAEWEDPQPVGDGLNSGVSNLEPDVTSDGLEIFFRRRDFPDESLHISDRLMVATRSSKSDPWNEASELPDTINSLPCLSHPTVTGDGLELYFASTDTPGQQCRGRNADIYVSKRPSREAEWMTPTLIESKAWTPGISADGLRLYFMEGDRSGTDQPQGSFGNGPSVFLRKRSSRSEEFGPPIELGDPPNTASSQFAVWGPEESPNGDALYFLSNRSGAQIEWAIWQATRAKPCDLNGDKLCNADDLTSRTLFRVNLEEGSEREDDILTYDISGDGTVNELDLKVWRTEAAGSNGFASPYQAGDANLDGTVDFSDFLALAEGFGGSGRNWSDGNFNGDREVGFTDFLALSANFGSTLSVSAAAVPEPSAAILLLVAMAISIRCRRASRSTPL